MRVVVGNVEQDVKVSIVLSCPRLAFMDNYFCAASTALKYGCSISKGTGAFWDQTMDKLLTEHSREDSGNHFICTMDYDSVFEPECLPRLVSVALATGYDAVAPLQTKRDDQKLLFTPKGMYGVTSEVTLPVEWWEQPAQPADSAHFGLTLLRCSALRRMPKPWFLGVPSQDGTWGDNREDPDIGFWRRWRECGNTLAICPQVAIGHAELVITWPNQRLKAIHQYPAHFWEECRRPPEAWGSPEHAIRCENGGSK